MKILITGNLGYVGPGLIAELRNQYPRATLLGFDIGYFSHMHTHHGFSSDCLLDAQHFGDVRQFPDHLLDEVDTVIHLAAISNDPIGNQFEEVTLDINYRASVALAKAAKRQGVKRFVFASSCSVYGAAEDAPRTEDSTLNPLTAYAKSKIYTEKELAPLADDDFLVTCFRFATACGWSERLRLDLVLNDFAAGALTAKEITILSDGTPWRPLINVQDMARALRWGHERSLEEGDSFLVLNAGTNAWNYQVKDLAYAVQELMPEVAVSINQNAEPDKRSYRVNFDRFRALAPHHQPQYDLRATVGQLLKGLKAIGFQDTRFRQSQLMRLNVIRHLRKAGLLNAHLQPIYTQKAHASNLS